MRPSPTTTTAPSRAAAALAVAVLASSAVFAAAWWLVHGHHTAALDRHAFDALAASQGGFLDRIAKPLEIVAPLVIAVAGLVLLVALVRRRAWAYTLIIVGGFFCTLVAAHLAKAAEQRPRPAHGLLYAGGYSFPSTDSALAVGVLAMAIVAAQLTSDRRRQRAVIAAGAVLTLGAGLLFIALRVHYLSDVIAGWALGVAVFSATALAVLAVPRRLTSTR